MRDGRCGMRNDGHGVHASRIPHLVSRLIREDHRISAKQPLLLQVFDCESPAISQSASSTTSRIRSATSRLESNGRSTCLPLRPRIVTRLVVTSNPAPGSVASFRIRSEEHTSELQSLTNLV